MPKKSIEIPEVGQIWLYKRKGAKHLKISVTSTGEIRVSIPSWLPYAVGAEFAKQKSAWLLLQQQQNNQEPLVDGMQIGKFHKLVFVNGPVTKVSTRISGHEIKVTLPTGMQSTEEVPQAAATKAAVRSLKKEASGALPFRLKTIAEANDFTYKSISIKQLRGRWGSCSSQKDITFNCYLMQLPWHLIDYVIIHELVHTRIMAHGAPFWHEVERYVPRLTQVRKEIKQYRPSIRAVINSTDQ